MSIMVTLPTYNESANILPLIDELLAVQDDISVVVLKVLKRSGDDVRRMMVRLPIDVR